MEQLSSVREKNILPAVILIIIGVIGAVTPSEFNWLSTVVFGSISLILFFGYNGLKSMLRPMTKPFVVKLLVLLLLSFCIKEMLIEIITIFNITDINSFVTNPAIIEAKQSTLSNNLIDVSETSISILGEELLVAGIILPVYSYLKKYRFGWALSNLVGCIAFGFMHVFAFDFQIWPCLMVGLSRYPFSQAWKSTDSVRGGMYIHLISDLIVLLPATLI